MSLTPYRVRLGLLGILVFLGTLVSQLPARLVADWIKNHSTQELNWKSVSGPVFDARIHGVEIAAGPDRIIYLDRLDLQTSVLSLLSGRIILNVSAYLGQSVIHSEIILGIWHWAMDDLNGVVDLNGLSRSIPELEIMGLRGMLVLTGEDLKAAYGSLPNSGDLEIDINELGLVMLNTSRPLGNYRVSTELINERGVDGKFETTTADSQLYLNGEFNLVDSDRTIQIRGQAWAGGNALQAVVQLLPLLGRVDNGRAKINWNSSF